VSNYNSCYWCNSPYKVYETRHKMLRYFCSLNHMRRFHSINHGHEINKINYAYAEGDFAGTLEFLNVFEDIPSGTILDLELLDS
jgi:hypothetical protein